MAFGEEEINKVVSLIHDGLTYRKIAEELKMPLSTLFDSINNSEHSARVKEALKQSADTYADKAEEVLKEAKGTLVEIQRARELAQHYRWKASKRRPKDYGDKMDLTTDGEKITSFQVGFKKPDENTEN